MSWTHSASPSPLPRGASPGDASAGPRDGGASGPEGKQEQRPQHLGAFAVIPPNPVRRNQLQKIATKELEDLEKWKERHRPGLITLTPQKLGGRISEAEVRQKQQLEHIQSKYQQKLKKEEYERRKREAEEADILKMKMIQREKANKLEEKQRQQEWQRHWMFAEDHCLKNTELLHRLDVSPFNRTPCPTNHHNLQPTSWTRSQSYKKMQREEENRKLQQMKEEQRRKAELLELKKREEERIRMKAQQNEQRRVNNDFLDRLQNNSQPGGVYQSGCLGNMPFIADSWPEHFQ
ncbi:epithelial-stromal interaction protein 1 isoform X2 [Podarcis raffonei]|uniref:epithelial-stromal interaction protein 1 isoform X2 n=1 Tax=Podarcis raffonei TaxID=65483 RepID=UPI002329546C|nr:epithelial-stromal interaction protein 1 isoform X2 [Podarcis raffonei]